MCKIAILDKTVGEAQHCDVVKDDPFFSILAMCPHTCIKQI